MEQLETLVRVCSKDKHVEMPYHIAKSSSSPKGTASPHPSGTTHPETSNTITPLPGASQQKNAKLTKKAGEKTGVTPSPALASSVAAAANNNKKKKPSKNFTETHKKWQETAKKMNGGKDVRIVTKKGPAKKLIYDYLYESFKPQTVDGIYKV